MKIGVLSDTHNQTANLQKALEIFKNEDIELLIHCGDITRVETAQYLCEFRVIAVFGNGDFLSGEIRETLKGFDRENQAKLRFEGELDGKQVGVTHGHLPGVLEEMIRSGRFDYIFTGHTHLRQDEMINQTRVVNPGALGGLKKQTHSICIVDLAKGWADFREID